MLFWFAILFGILTAWLLGRRSLYSNWILLFNILVSIYVGVMLSPILLDMLDETAEGIGYNCAAFILLIAVVIFVTLHLIARYSLVVDEVDIDFNELVEMIGKRIVAFFTGFCVAVLFIFLIAVMIMPYKFSPWMKFIRTENTPVTVAVKPMTKMCNLINKFTLQRYPEAPQYVLTKLTNLRSRPQQTEDSQTEDSQTEPLDDQQFPDLLTPGPSQADNDPK